MAAMIRSLSSCFEATRIWRSTEGASLEKKPSTRLSQEPCVGVKVNSKRPAGCSASQALGGTCLSVDGSKCRRVVSTNLIHPKYGTVAPSLAQAIDRGHWMHTGDLATIDEDGYVNIVGRIKDMVIRGGENVYPREIEEFLFRHPKIEAVQVVGVPDPKYGEELCAWINVKPGAAASAEDVQSFCRGQIAHYKIPRYIKFVDAFPMTVTGKVQKFIMREEMIKELGLSEQKTACPPGVGRAQAGGRLSHRWRRG